MVILALGCRVRAYSQSRWIRRSFLLSITNRKWISRSNRVLTTQDVQSQQGNRSERKNWGGTWSPASSRLLFCSRPAGTQLWLLRSADTWPCWNLKHNSCYCNMRTAELLIQLKTWGRDKKTALSLTCEWALRSDVVGDEASCKHEQNHEQFGPGETMTAHLYLKILDTQGNVYHNNKQLFCWT